MNKRIKQSYFNFIDKMSSRNIGIIVCVLFFISLLPVVYVGIYNYATGDDYWYGVHTYRGWISGGLLGALKGSWQTVKEFYYNWQGTWFTMFLFTLSPHHFAENGYVITIFLALGLWIGSNAYLADYYLVKKMGFAKGVTAVIVCLISYLGIQYIPRTTSGLYWFNGLMHYSVPFFLAVLAIVHSHKFVESKRKGDYWILFVSFLLLGGGSYLAPLAATMVVVYILISQIKIKRNEKKVTIEYDWRCLWILLAFAVEMIGLVVSFKAPGNSVRGGEEFGADLTWALRCVYYAIDRGIYLGLDYFLENVVTVIVYVILAFLIWEQLWRVKKERIKFSNPFLFVLFMNGVYWATYTPEIYSRSDVSGGVKNTYFHIFLIITLANMIYVHGWLQKCLVKYWEKKSGRCKENVKNIQHKSIFYGKRYKACIEVPAIILGCVLFFAASCLSEVKTTNEYCMECISNGSLKKYFEIRKEQHEYLISTEEKNVTIPEMEAPYPLLHLGLGEEGGGQNENWEYYYDKESIKAEIIVYGE